MTLPTILRPDSKWIRFTFRPSGNLTVKIPKDIKDDDIIDYWVAVAISISSKVQPVKQTLRGKIEDSPIRKLLYLLKDNKDLVVVVDFEDISNLKTRWS